MEAEILAQRTITALSAGEGKRSYPWLLVEHDIVSPAELIKLTYQDIQGRWPQSDPKLWNQVWSCCGYAQRVNDGYKFVGYYDPEVDVWLVPNPYEPIGLYSLILFWPPRFEGDDALEFITAWGSTDEQIFDGLVFLFTQQLPIYAGARAVMDFTLSGVGGTRYERAKTALVTKADLTDTGNEVIE